MAADATIAHGRNRSFAWRAPATALTASTALGRWRQILTYSLGGIWLLDGGLQFQSFMYTQAFPSSLQATGQGSPSWISGPVNWASKLFAHHLAPLNTLSALLQVAIGLAIFVPRLRKPALVTSIVWALMIWWMGEGLGGMFGGPIMPFMGLPGAVVIYAFIAVLVWPRASVSDAAGAGAAAADSATESVALASPTTRLGAKLPWLVLWALFVWETLRGANRAPSALHDMVAGMASGEPGWIASIDRGAATLLNHRGTEWSIALAIVFALIAVAVFLPPALSRPLLVLAVIAAAVIWVVGENFGTIATGNATDPNSGPLLALLALCYWPVRATAD